MASTKENLDVTAPDPDEDDLDDLDDVLDKFDAKPTGAKTTTAAATTAPSASGPGRPTVEYDALPGSNTATAMDFESQLQAGMAELINQLGENPEMQQQFEKMMQELVAAGAASTDAKSMEHIAQATAVMPGAETDLKATTTKSDTKATTGNTKKEDSFQDTIRKTMERMQQSGDAATAATASAGSAGTGLAGMSEDELLAQMMKELGSGQGAAEDFNQMLLTMMTQLTNKEILYEPMKELHEKFPGWLEKRGPTTSEADLKRYKEQASLVSEIVARFERTGYSDDNEEDREYIVERMQKMQAAGSPPADLVGDMSATAEALGDLDAGCPTQ